MKRAAQVERKTSETDIKIKLTIDGTGKSVIKTPVAFFNHMLELFSKHGLFDLSIQAQGDVEIDFHHTVEDVGICLGQAVHKALGSTKNIQRYGEAAVPMDEALAQVCLDISGRPYLVFKTPPLKGKTGDFDLDLIEEFFQAFSNHSRTALHINVLYGKNYHHIVEAVFKAFGRALDKATQIDKRASGVPSTKGIL
ncbi:MAG: imidazoleglycerol-phosphate dehydratase HisB [Pseudomonadota bacterium]